MVLISAVLLVVFAAIRGASQWASVKLEQSLEQPTMWSEMLQITLKGERTMSRELAMPALYERTLALIDVREQQAQARLEATLEARHAQLLAHSLAYVPQFADWYYSLRGEYLRFFHAAFGDLPDLIAQQMIRHVLEPAALQQQVAQLGHETEALLLEEVQDTFRAADRLITRLVQSQQISLNKEGEPDQAMQAVLSDGDRLAQQIASYVNLNTDDIARQSVAAVAAGVAGKGMVSLLAGAAGKAGVKAAGSAMAGAGTGATGGALLCGSTIIAAPLAPACAAVGGVVVGLGTWVAVDAAVLEAQEFFGREALEADISAALTTELAQLHARLQMQYDDALRASFAELRRGFAHLFEITQATPSRDFVPARVMGEP
ncbi:hypothetical protein [Thiorhodospira sibirica]|uniref:hypothetical protein n=1 Tax=Thiorhodospira sibirica TaxID=154347 RepID=UPI00022C1D5A|nr:hypothetical protein [Thiorhodospira sibirica]